MGKTTIIKRETTTKAYDRRYRLIDTSSRGSSGDSYDLVEQIKVQENYYDENGKFCITNWVWKTIRIIDSTHETWQPYVKNKIGRIGAFGPKFNNADII